MNFEPGNETKTIECSYKRNTAFVWLQLKMRTHNNDRRKIQCHARAFVRLWKIHDREWGGGVQRGRILLWLKQSQYILPVDRSHGPQSATHNQTPGFNFCFTFFPIYLFSNWFFFLLLSWFSVILFVIFII